MDLKDLTNKTMYSIKKTEPTPKDPTPRNKWRKKMKNVYAENKLKYLRNGSAEWNLQKLKTKK